MNIRNQFLNFFYLFLNQYLFHILLYFSDLGHILHYWHYFLSYLRLRDDSFNDMFFCNNLLDYGLDRYWYLNGHDYLSIYRYGLDTLMNQMYYFFNFQLNRSLLNHSNRHLSNHLLGDDSFLESRDFHWFLDDSIHWFFDLDIDIFDSFYLFDNFLNYWHLNYSLYLHYLLSNHILLDNLLYKLRHLHYFFNYSRHNHHLLYYLLYLYHSWHLHHLLNDLLNLNWYFLYSIHNGGHFDYLLFNVFDYLGHIYVDIDIF